MIARVLIDGPFELVFDYVIPEGLAVVEGCRVRVPIRQKNTSGTVLSVTPPPEQSEFAMREVKSLIDPEPLITPVLLKTARWIANYYGSRIEGVIRSILPEAVRTEDNSAKTRRIATAVADPDPEALAKLEKRAAKQHAILTRKLPRLPGVSPPRFQTTSPNAVFSSAVCSETSSLREPESASRSKRAVSLMPESSDHGRL